MIKVFAKAVELITKSIFPIISETKVEKGLQIGVRGTGFFIDDNGAFLTANHVMIKNHPNSKLLYRGKLPEKVINPAKEIKEVYKNVQKDVFIGEIKDVPGPKVQFLNGPPKIGSSICLCGYPMPQFLIQEGKINPINIRRYWQPSYVVDYMLFEGKKTFITQHPSLKGMSGGPVFDIEGSVAGIDLAVLTRKVPIPNTDPQVVRNGIILKMEEIGPILNELGF